MARRAYKAKTKCVTVSTGSDYDFNTRSVEGRKTSFSICTIRNGLSIRRVGRRGGLRGELRTRGGITMCTAHGAQSKCLRAQDFIAFPGGGASLRRRSPGMVLNGYRRKRR